MEDLLNPCKTRAAFAIGRALKGHINEEARTIFGFGLGFRDHVNAATRAVAFFESQVQAARLAIKTWSLLAKRLNISKDMRRMISEMVWNSRHDANYPLQRITRL